MRLLFILDAGAHNSSLQSLSAPQLTLSLHPIETLPIAPSFYRLVAEEKPERHFRYFPLLTVHRTSVHCGRRRHNKSNKVSVVMSVRASCN